MGGVGVCGVVGGGGGGVGWGEVLSWEGGHLGKGGCSEEKESLQGMLSGM